MSINETSNSTRTTTPQPQTTLDQLYSALIVIDFGIRVYGFVIFLIFTVFVIFSPCMRSKSSLYSTHCTFVCSIFNFMMFLYLLPISPNQLQCTVSEIVWLFSNYIRSYSILILAIYRYIAVFKKELFKKINDSDLILAAPLIVIWTFSIVSPIATIVGFNETSSPSVRCQDASTSSTEKTIVLDTLNFSLMIFLPSLLIIVIYCLIMQKLNSIRQVILKFII